MRRIRLWFPPLLVLMLAVGCTAGVAPDPESKSATERNARGAGQPTMPSTGRVFIKDTDYSVPPGAYFVSPSGDDSNAGTESAPWKTVARAVSGAPSGGTVVLRQGVYRERITVDGKALTFQPYPHEQVWFKGSVSVGDWIADGAIWRKDGWTAEFADGGKLSDYHAGYEMADYADMVFVDGEPLRQVGSKDAVAAGTFYVDDASDRLYIGSDPGGKSIEAAVLSLALTIRNAPGTVVRGLGFQHYAPTLINQKAPVQAHSPSVTFENNTFAWNAAAGLSVIAPDGVVRGNIMLNNGHLGLHATRADRLLVEQNTLSYNNQEHVWLDWEAGGLKVTRSEGMIWRDNLAEGNRGRGFWCDISCYNTKILRNVARQNIKTGIDYELSAKGIIASNVLVNNGFAGININESSDVDIYNNTTVRNEVNIRVAEGKRTNSDTTERNLIPWDVEDIVIKNNLLSGATSDSLRMLLVDDYSGSTGPKPGEYMVSALDYNGYYRARASTPRVLLLWSLGASDGNFRTMEAVRKRLDRERHGISIDNAATNPFFVDEAGGDYRLKAGSRARGAGEQLPAEVANALGVRGGIPVDLGALHWATDT